MPGTEAHQAPQSKGFARQEYRSGLPCPIQGIFLIQGLNPWPFALQADSLPPEPPGKPLLKYIHTHTHTHIHTYIFTHRHTYICTHISFFSVTRLLWLFVTPWCTLQSSLSYAISQNLSKFMSIESVIIYNQLILCHPLLFLPSIFPSIRFFSRESALLTGGQCIGVWALALVLPVNIQGWFPLGLTGVISLKSKGLSSVLASTTIQKH